MGVQTHDVVAGRRETKNLPITRFVALLSLTLLPISTTLADDANWMRDNLYRFRNNDLTALSIPASHDAGMYEHDIDRFEIGVEDLHAHLSLSGPLVPDVSWGFSETGILEAGELLAIFDQLMGIVREIDTQCIDIPLAGEFCVTFGLEDAVWEWVKPYYELATQKPGDLSITQNLDLYGQLSSGVRRFDLRPKALGGELYLHHSQAGIKDFEQSKSGEWSLDIPVPCVEVPIVGGCFPGTGESYHLGKFSFDAGGAVRSVSATGPSVAEVLSDVRRFMEEDHRELVILSFGAYWAGWQGNEFSGADYAKLVAAIDSQLQPWLLTTNMLPSANGLSAKERLMAARLPDLIADQGRVIVTLGSDSFAYTDPGRGLWPASAVSAYGAYANSDDVDKMREDQRGKWYKANEDRFSLWWTLTCLGFDCSVRDLAAKANPALSAFVDSLTIPNGNGNNVNEIWVDFSEETAATQIAIGLNPVAATIDVKPGNDTNAINPRLEGVIWVAIFSDGESLGDALQIDLSTVRFGTLGAAPDLHRVADLNRDGLSDLLLRFRMPESGLTCGTREAVLTGRTYTSQRFVGIDSIATVGCPRVDRNQARSEQIVSERLRHGIGR
jgi:hypothetical protein